MMTVDLGTMRLEGRHETEMLQDTWMQFVREESKVFGNAGGSGAHRGERRLNRVIPDAASVQQIADVDSNPRDFLAGIVMQVARDACALGFLCVDQPASQRAHDSLGNVPPATLYQQSGNQACLKDEKNHGAGDVRFVTVPRA